MMPVRSILSLDLRHHRVGPQWQWRKVTLVDDSGWAEGSSDPLCAARGLLNGFLLSAAILIAGLTLF